MKTTTPNSIPGFLTQKIGKNNRRLTKEAEDDIVSSDPEFQAGVLSIVCIVVEGGEVLQGRPVAELVLVLQCKVVNNAVHTVFP